MGTIQWDTPKLYVYPGVFSAQVNMSLMVDASGAPMTFRQSFSYQVASGPHDANLKFSPAKLKTKTGVLVNSFMVAALTYQTGLYQIPFTKATGDGFSSIPNLWVQVTAGQCQIDYLQSYDVYNNGKTLPITFSF